MTFPFTFISAFYLNDIISSDSKWAECYKNPKYWIHIWGYHIPPPPNLYNYKGGPWYIPGPPIRYIGISYKGRLGWIKVDISDPNNPKFISYAIKK